MKVFYRDKAFIKDVFYKSFPLIIGTIVTGLITLVDSFMVGVFQHKGSSELAATSLANKYVNIVNIFVQSIIAMFSFLIYQYKGNDQKEKIKETFKILVNFVLFIDLIAILMGWFMTNQIMEFFQGANYSDPSTHTGLAQDYLKVTIFSIIPASLFSIYLIGLNAFGKQKIIIPLSAISIGLNALFNYLFYKVAGLGLRGIMVSTITADTFFMIAIFWWIWHIKINRYIYFNIWKLFHLDKNVLRIGLRSYGMGLQNILWSSISIGITIIYSRWYGDIANNPLAIATPLVNMFYSALDGVASTKGYFVGTHIGSGNKEKALENDKRINMYTFVVAFLEGVLMVALSFALPLLWINASSQAQWNATLLLIAVGCTYPIAAMSKTLLGSFKVAGMGKTIILSNGLFALFFEFMVPLILFLIHIYATPLSINFWEIYMISRLVKLIKLPPTIYFWRKKKWLYKKI